MGTTEFAVTVSLWERLFTSECTDSSSFILNRIYLTSSFETQAVYMKFSGQLQLNF